MAKKDVHGMLNEIMNYDSLRKVLRMIYMYGAYSDSDLLEKKIVDVKERAFKDLIKRIDNYLNAGEYSDSEHFSFHKIPNRKNDKRARKIIKDPFKNNFDFLASTYHQHTVSISDMLFYVFFLFVFENEGDDAVEFFMNLSDLRVPATLKDSCNDLYRLESSSAFTALDLYYAMEEFYAAFSGLNHFLDCKDDTSESTVFPLSKEQFNAKLSEFVDLGYVDRLNSTDYKLSNDIFSLFNTFDDAEDEHSNLLDILSAVTFFFNFSCLCIPGYFLSEKIRQLLSATYIDMLYQNDSYRIKNRSSHFFFDNPRHQNVVDDDVTWSLLSAIDSGNSIEYDYQTSSFDMSTSFSVFPIKVIDDTTYGRHYLWGYELSSTSKIKQCQILIHRIDRIFNLRVNKVTADNLTGGISTEEEFQDWISDAFNVDGSYNEPRNIFLEFTFDNSGFANYQMKRLLKSKYSSSLVPLNDNVFSLNIIAKNPAEAIPWINSFGCFVRVLTNSDPLFYETYCKYIKDNSAIYEPV